MQCAATREKKKEKRFQAAGSMKCTDEVLSTTQSSLVHDSQQRVMCSTMPVKSARSQVICSARLYALRYLPTVRIPGNALTWAD
jgi:hypothetical protein